MLDFLRGRTDALLFGAQAVNAYVAEPRMTQDIDLMSTRAAELAEEIRAHVGERFSIATRVRVIRGGMGFRVYQLQEPRNRHLVDVRAVRELPASRAVDGVLVLGPPELIAAKVVSMVARDKSPKGATDLADLRRLLLAFPGLKVEGEEVDASLTASQASPAAFTAWRQLVAEDIQPEDDDDV
ncbi:MAG: nucleotidyl transferase AbiEii/AbiGii toxin family protein [Polyangiaceae bacterium]